ncbi:MAG: ABC-type transport auxiliary lipoprotein family protein [Hyphomicrobiaceae bacterium]|nr:ABC-type transport auxiliary lipoprotein family protein [Hyphomicrobiaceae bacterium]
MRPRHLITAATLALSGALLGGCVGGSAAPPATYDLVAPRVMTLTAPRAAKFQLVVNEPSAVRSLETDRIMVKSGPRVAYYKGAAWSDRLPRLMQARMVEAFQNAGLVSAVGSRADRLDADYELSTQVQAFQVEVNQGQAEAHANLYVKVIDGDNGRMVASRGFEARVATSPKDADQMVVSLNQAFENVVHQVVPWVAKNKRR